MLDYPDSAIPRVPFETPADIFLDEVQGQAIVVDKNDKSGMTAERFQAKRAGTGKEIEDFGALDGIAENIK